MTKKATLKSGLICILLTLFLVACSGGGGGSDNVSAVSHYVPYLLGAPSVSYTANATDPSKYDVTVTLQADGPTGVAFVNLWIQSDADFNNLDLVNVPGTNTWTATTLSLVPMAAGNYYIDSITLDDADPFGNSVVRTGWYFVNPLGGNAYMVDEREIDPNVLDFLFYNSGTTNIGVTRFTLP